MATPCHGLLIGSIPRRACDCSGPVEPAPPNRYDPRLSSIPPWSPVSASLLQQTEAALQRGQSAVQAALGALAGASGDAKGIDAGLERNQGAAMRLAHAHAQLFAAREMLAYGKLGALEASLAAAFGGLTLQLLRDQPSALALPLAG